MHSDIDGCHDHCENTDPNAAAIPIGTRDVSAVAPVTVDDSSVVQKLQ